MLEDKREGMFYIIFLQATWQSLVYGFFSD